MGSLPNAEERQDLKEQIMGGVGGDYFKLQARCVEKFGAAAGIFARQLLFWEGKGHDAEGWIYKSEDEMELETGLRRRGQREARKVLGSAGVLEEERKGLPRRLFYRVDLVRLAEVLETSGSTLNQWKVGMRRNPETGKLYRPEPTTLNPSYSQVTTTDPTCEDGTTDRTSEDDNTDPASKVPITDLASEDGITDPAITESTSENTAETTQENMSRELLLQEARIGQNGRSAPGPQEQEIEVEREDEETTPISEIAFGRGEAETDKPSRATPSEINRIFKILTDESYETCRVYRRYEKGQLSDRDLLESVSYELTGSFDDAEHFRWSVEECVKQLLEEDEGIA
jgi:hypothetical protein